MKVAIIGTGNVGMSLGEALSKNNEVVYGSRKPEDVKSRMGSANVETIEEAVKGADMIILAVPFSAAKEAIHDMHNSEKGKILVDVSNPIDKDFKWVRGFNESAAEEIAKHAKDAKVVKAFNTIFAVNMKTGQVGSEKLTTFVAGNDEDAKGKVMELARSINMEPIDVGTLDKARYIEPTGLLLVELGYGRKLGTGIGIKLVKGS
ncbi:NADP oxidoreductase coenzyme F420-dependent [mine drainage metagenome]|uniref:NADP oxidoreductase coenzyme F420-dependent n=1 Tax=mine drainage metagenome TaxID=410659 RepID=T0ZMB7_9ZZZZ